MDRDSHVTWTWLTCDLFRKVASNEWDELKNCNWLHFISIYFGHFFTFPKTSCKLAPCVLQGFLEFEYLAAVFFFLLINLTFVKEIIVLIALCFCMVKIWQQTRTPISSRVTKKFNTLKVHCWHFEMLQKKMELYALL